MPFSHLARAGSQAFNLGCTLMTGAAIIALSSPSASAQTTIGDFYFFGDSATGQGNWSAIVGDSGGDHSPYSSNNGFQRESNGLIWAEMLGRDVDIILDPDADSTSINFAISGAHMTRGGDLAAFGIETGVLTQTELFGSLVENGAISVEGNDVAFMLAGANDYLDRLELDEPAEEIMADIASAAAANVSLLAKSGIKTIILSQIQPLQYAPQFADAPEVRAALSDLVDDTNAAIITAIEKAGLSPDINVVTMKYSAMIAHLTENAAALGFTDITNSCYDDETGEICSTDAIVQNKHLFFDDLHFTERAHALEAQWWMATLDGANGEASRQTARIPRIAYEQLESHRSHVRPGTHTSLGQSFGAWLAPVRSSLQMKASDIAPTTDLSLDGAILGMEGRFADHFVLGGALSVGETTAKFNDGARHRMEGGSASLYGALDYQECGRLSLTMTRGEHEIKEISRATGVALLQARGQTKSEYWDIELAARSKDQIGSLSIDHGLSLSTGGIDVDGYSETGASGLALRFQDQTLNYHRLSVDTVIKSRPIGPSHARFLRPVFDAAYIHQFGDDEYGLTSQLIDNTAQQAVIRSQAPTESRIDIGLGAEAALSDHWLLTVRYGMQWADDIGDADEGSLTLRATF